MIHTTPNAGKFRRLVRKLRPMLNDLPVSVETVAVGILERLWHATISSAFCGDIGKFDNEEIAEFVGWHGDADTLINLLVSERWLDASEEHRLVIHDWHEHAPRHVKANVAKYGDSLCFASIHKEPPNDSEDSARTLPNGATPNLTKPNQTPTGRWASRTEELSMITVDGKLWNEALPLMQRIKAAISPERTLKPADRELACKAAVIALRLFDERWLDDVLDGIKKRRTPLESPWGYFKSSLAKSAQRLGDDFYRALDSVSVPKELLEPKLTPA